IVRAMRAALRQLLVIAFDLVDVALNLVDGRAPDVPEATAADARPQRILRYLLHDVHDFDVGRHAADFAQVDPAIAVHGSRLELEIGGVVDQRYAAAAQVEDADRNRRRRAFPIELQRARSRLTQRQAHPVVVAPLQAGYRCRKTYAERRPAPEL